MEALPLFLTTSWPLIVQEGLSSRSWERRHSKVQVSPSRTAVVFKRWTIVMCKSVNKYNQ